MDGEKMTGENKVEGSVAQEADKILATPEIVEQLKSDVNKEKGALQKLSEATHRSIKGLALAFAMLLATEAKNAAADEAKPKEALPTLVAKAEVKSEFKGENVEYIEGAIKDAAFAKQNIEEIRKLGGDQGLQDTYGHDFVGDIEDAIKVLSNPELKKISEEGAASFIMEMPNSVKRLRQFVALEKDSVTSPSMEDTGSNGMNIAQSNPQAK